MSIDVVQVKSFVSSNLSNVKKTQQVASKLNCSLDKLKKSFYKAEKVSLSRFIRDSRVARMKERLLISEDACKVICLEMGLREDVGSRLFKNSTGMTMEEFRRSYYGSASSILRSEIHAGDVNRPSPQLVITEQVVRQALCGTVSRDEKNPARRSNGAWIQGPAN
jgi:AraC-like DNA-binding protein